MSVTHRTGIWLLLFLVAGGSTSCWRASVAQDPADYVPKAGEAQAAHDSENPTLGSSDASARSEVLQSDAWKQAEYAFEQWLSVQQIYTPAEVAKLKRDLQLRIAGMTEQELQQFLFQMQQKLNVLLSDEAREARTWIGQRMSLLASQKREEFRQKLPDVARMTPAQLQQYLSQYQEQRRQSQQTAEMARKLRESSAQRSQQAIQAQQQALQQARQQQQAALANQATRRVQQGYQQSMENWRRNTWAPNPRYWNPVVPPGAYGYGYRYGGYYW